MISSSREIIQLSMINAVPKLVSPVSKQSQKTQHFCPWSKITTILPCKMLVISWWWCKMVVIWSPSCLAPRYPWRMASCQYLRVKNWYRVPHAKSILSKETLLWWCFLISQKENKNWTAHIQKLHKLVMLKNCHLLGTEPRSTRSFQTIRAHWASISLKLYYWGYL